MSEQTIVRIELNDLVRLCNERRAYKAEAERGEQHLMSAENALIEKDSVIERLIYAVSAADDIGDSHIESLIQEIDELWRKNKKLKKKLKTWKKYAEEMEGAAMFGAEFEGIKCTFEPESAVDECDHSFWLGRG